VVLRVTQHRVAGVEHVLGVVEFSRDRVLDVVEKLEDVAAGHDAACGHRDSTGLLDDRAELIERLKYSVHGNILQA